MKITICKPYLREKKSYMYIGRANRQAKLSNIIRKESKRDERT